MHKPSYNSLPYFLERFSHLNRASGCAPHKPVLLLTLLAAVEQELIPTNFVPITPELAALFHQHWLALVPPGKWHEKMNMPFRHLIYDGFWQLTKDGVPQTAELVGEPSSLLQLADRIDGGMFVPDLWILLQETEAREALRAELYGTYFPHAAQPVVQPVDLLAQKADQLIAEASAKFRIRPVQDAENTGVFVRHALFPSIVKSLYSHVCAVCKVDTHTDTGKTVLDAAHILPFSTHHNDDPRNGLALCKNHHWGFDEGVYGISDDYNVLVSKRLKGHVPLVSPGTPLILPAQEHLRPAVEAIRWHRKHVFLK